MAVAYSNSVYASGTGTTASATLSISGADRAVFVGLRASGNPTISNPLFEGVAMTNIVANTTADVYVYYYLNPPTGSRTANITMNASNQWGLFVMSLTGVHQTVAIGTHQEATNTEGANISASVTGAANGLVVDFASLIIDAMTANAGQTRYPTSPPNGDSFNGGFASIGMSAKGGTGSVTMTWTPTGGPTAGDNVLVAVPFLPSGGGGGPILTNQKMILLGVG